MNIGNDMAVTLSIGIGMNGDSYIRNYEYARTAIDMALGRGGDQAVVKDGTKIRYYRRQIAAAGKNDPCQGTCQSACDARADGYEG